MDSKLRDAYRYHRHGKRSGLAQAVAASRALELARKDVSDGMARYPSSLGNPWNPRFAAYGEKHLRWIENTERAGLRFVGFADEIVSLRHNGWYADEFQDEIYRGAVYQLPARRGESVYIYGYDDPNNEGAALLSFDWTADKEDAARWADSLAERAAGSDRECREAQHARMMYEDAGEELKSLRRRLMALCRELRDEANLPPEICATLREAIGSKWERRGELFAERARLLADYGRADGWRDY